MQTSRVLRCTKAILSHHTSPSNFSAQSLLYALYNRECQHTHTSLHHKPHITQSSRNFSSDTTNNNSSGNNADNVDNHTHNTNKTAQDSTTERMRNRTDIDASNNINNKHSIDDLLAGKVTERDVDEQIDDSSDAEIQHTDSTTNQPFRNDDASIDIDGDDTVEQEGDDDAHTDILDINNPPKLNINLYKLLAENNLTVDDIDLGAHTDELREHVQFIIDGIKEGKVDFSDHEQVTLRDYGDSIDDTADNIDQSIEVELGYTLEGNAPPHIYKTGLPVDKLSCQFCAAHKEFMYQVRQANKQHKSYEMSSEIYDMSDNLLLHFSNVELLYSYLNERGMVTPRHQNGNCAKHQRKLAQEIKRARYIGLLSYVTKFKVDESYVREVYGSNLVQREADRRNAELRAISEEQRAKRQLEEEALAQMVGENDVNVNNQDYDTPKRR